MKIDIKEWPTISFAAVLIIFCLILFSIPFNKKREVLAQQIKAKVVELSKAKTMIEKKGEIEAAYTSAQSHNSARSVGEWVKKISELSKGDGLSLESIIPRSDSISDPGAYSVIIRFHTDLGRFAAFTHHLVTEEYFCLINGVSLEKAEDGLLNGELALKRVIV